MPNVVRVDVVRTPATRKRAAAVARPQRALQRRGDHAPLAPDVERRAVVVFDDRDQAAVAGEALHRLDRQIRAPRPSAEGFLVDMHDDLIVIRDRRADSAAPRPR